MEDVSIPDVPRRSLTQWKKFQNRNRNLISMNACPIHIDVALAIDWLC